MIDKDFQRRTRDDLPLPITIAALGRDGPPTKMRDGRLFFLCPHCRELQAAVNPRNNLAHCFACSQNLNNIDLLMLLGYDFVAAVLEGLLERHVARMPKRPATSPAR